MPLRLTGRRVEITDSLREWIQSKTDRYFKFHDRISLIEVTLGQIKERLSCAILVKAPRTEYRATVSSTDLRTAFDDCNDKILKQMDKKKMRVVTRKRGATPKVAAVTPHPEAAEFVAPAGLPAWIHPEQADLPRCSVEAAVAKLDALSGRNFIVFRNALSNGVQVIYKRGDGEYGLIET